MDNTIGDIFPSNKLDFDATPINDRTALRRPNVIVKDGDLTKRGTLLAVLEDTQSYVVYVLEVGVGKHRQSLSEIDVFDNCSLDEDN